MNWISRFKSLPVSTRRLLSIGIITALVVALPLFVWAIVNQKFLIFKRAATAESYCPAAEACPYYNEPTLLRSCHPADSDGTPNDSLCNTAGRVETCGPSYTQYCCPGPGQAWTTDLNACPPLPTPTAYPSLTPTPTPYPVLTPTPTPYPPNSCGGTCGNNYNCTSGLICSNGFCRNPNCVNDYSCTCGPTPTATPTTPPFPRLFHILFKLDGVSGDAASYQKLGDDAVKVSVVFKSPQYNYEFGYGTGPIRADYVNNGIYAINFWAWSTGIPPGYNYTVTLKGEKHVAVKFCQNTGQTEHCNYAGQIIVPYATSAPIYMDFTGIPLPPGDLDPQDGNVSTKGPNNDLSKLLAVLAKAPPLSREDLLVGDLDYNGVVDIKDLYLFSKALQIRYDEN